MELHEALTELAAEQGAAVFGDGQSFKGVLDDYLDEGTASRGTIHLLADAVGLGALEAMLTVLDTGASPEAAVEDAGRRLARDRGSADVTGSQWACAILGYALGRVPLELAQRLRSGGAVAPPSTYGAPPPSATATAPAPSWELPGVGGDYTALAPPQAHAGLRHPDPTWRRAGRARRRLALIVGAAVVALVLAVAGIVGAVALLGDGDAPAAGPESSIDARTPATDIDPDEPTAATATPYPDGLTVEGSGYAYNLPGDWTIGTDQVPPTAATQHVDTVAIWGRVLENAPSNLIVERAPANGVDDPTDLAEQWQDALEESSGSAPTPIDDIEIDGERGVGVELNYTNAKGVEIHQIGYLAVWHGHQYSIAVSFADGSRAKPIFRNTLATWQWVS